MKRRLFIAIELPQEFKFQINQLINLIKEDYPQVKWEYSFKLHLTLKFLGYTVVEPEKILSVLQKNLTGQKSFSIEFNGLDVFANRGAVLFLVVKPSTELKHLFNNTESALTVLGFAKDNRSFHPHLTLGRSKNGLSGLRQVRSPLPPMSVWGIGLFQSHPTQNGTKYTRLGEIGFSGN